LTSRVLNEDQPQTGREAPTHFGSAHSEGGLENPLSMDDAARRAAEGFFGVPIASRLPIFSNTCCLIILTIESHLDVTSAVACKVFRQESDNE
jgi:hypothetical protein